MLHQAIEMEILSDNSLQSFNKALEFFQENHKSMKMDQKDMNDFYDMYKHIASVKKHVNTIQNLSNILANGLKKQINHPDRKPQFKRVSQQTHEAEQKTRTTQQATEKQQTQPTREELHRNNSRQRVAPPKVQRYSVPQRAVVPRRRATGLRGLLARIGHRITGFMTDGFSEPADPDNNKRPLQ